MLNVPFGQSFSFAVSFGSLKRVISVVERNNFGNSGLIVYIKDIVIFPSREEVIARIVSWLGLHPLRTTFSYHVSYLHPSPILPDKGLGIHAISEYSDLPFLLPLHGLYLTH